MTAFVSRFKLGLLVVLCLVAVSWTGVARAADSFFQLDGVQGESRAAGHQNWMTVKSFSLVATPGNPSTDLVVGLASDKSLTKLLGAMWHGNSNYQHGALDVVLAGNGPGGTTMHFQFTGLQIRGVHLSQSTGGEPTLQVIFAYSRIEISYKSASATAQDSWVVK